MELLLKKVLKYCVSILSFLTPEKHFLVVYEYFSPLLYSRTHKAIFI